MDLSLSSRQSLGPHGNELRHPQHATSRLGPRHSPEGILSSTAPTLPPPVKARWAQVLLVPSHSSLLTPSAHSTSPSLHIALRSPLGNLFWQCSGAAPRRGPGPTQRGCSASGTRRPVQETGPREQPQAAVTRLGQGWQQRGCMPRERALPLLIQKTQLLGLGLHSGRGTHILHLRTHCTARGRLREKTGMPSAACNYITTTGDASLGEAARQMTTFLWAGRQTFKRSQFPASPSNYFHIFRCPGRAKEASPHS